MKFHVTVERVEVTTYEVEAPTPDEAYDLIGEADEIASDYETERLVSIEQVDGEPRPITTYTCRDIGYGVETGEVFTPATGPPDWIGKRPYLSTDGVTTVYLFDDEVSQ